MSKKKKKDTWQDFSDGFFELMEEDVAPVSTKKESKKDIAPVYVNKTAPLFNDIAPMVTTTKKKDDDGGLDFFQKGSFSDGYQFGDVTKAILGTTADTGVGIVKGASKLVGGVLDAGAYGIAGVADVLGKDKYADDLRKKAQKNVIDDAFEGTDSFLNKYSVLGRTSDAIAEGIGQVGSIILTGGIAGALGAGAGVATAATTGLMGVSSIGSGMSEAYAGGATDEEAATYGLIKGVVDAGSEMIFGGLGKTVKAVGLSKGLSSLDDVFAQKLSSKIANQTAKNFIQYGVKASAEGVEEVLAGAGTIAAKKLTYMSEAELNDLIRDENLMEQFVVGAVTSGIAQSGVVPGVKGGSLREANQTGRDFISGMSQNEQAVVDKVWKDRIAEAEENGKLTKREKDKLYDEVVRDMDRGYISTDTIEEVLGGETYKGYKNTVDYEDGLQSEFDQLNKMRQGDMTGEQVDRRNELKAQLEELKTKSQRGQMQTNLRNEVMGLVKGDRLAESYNEQYRRGQTFEADLTKYDEKQQATIRKAIDSGILNNTNRTHEFVDMVAKITADKGVLFDFTNNEKLKTSGFAVDGKAVNGFVTKDGVTLNIDSAKSINRVVGHEITHVLEGTELYDSLKTAVTEYAKTKQEYHGRYAQLSKLYEGMDADIDAELTADLVGDYLFSDENFVKHLSTNHRNVFQKIYDEIKYLCKVATAGSKEARQLEKVKRAFDKAYKESGKQAEIAATEETAMFPDDLAPASESEADTQARLNSLVDADAPQETEPYYGEENAPVAPRNPFDGRDYNTVGKKNVHAYMYDHPEVKPFFQMQAQSMLGDLRASVKGERWYNDQMYYESGGEYGWSGTQRHTTDDIAYLLDNGYTYAQIEQGLNAIIEGNGAENIAIAKKIEFALNDQLMNGYTDINGVEIPANEYYLNALAKQQTAETIESQIPTHTDADAPAEIAPVMQQPKPQARPATKAESKSEPAPRVAKVLTEEPDVPSRKRNMLTKAMTNFADKGWVFENLAKKTKNRELEGKYNFMHYSEGRAQEYIKDNLMPLVERAEASGKTKQLYDYVYHLHNIDRMSLDTPENAAKRAAAMQHLEGLSEEQINALSMKWITKNTSDETKTRIEAARAYVEANQTKNKPVFGEEITAEESRKTVKQLERMNPEFKALGDAIVRYNTQLREMLVDGGVISQETADLWAKMYPHYVPIRRAGHDGQSITVPLDTNKTGVNAPIKRATGGSSDILPLFDTMAMRTEQTFKAIARNSFGTELMHTLDSVVDQQDVSLDEAIGSMDNPELLQEGKNGQAPTFTVFENGKRVTFEITEDMYDALKPTSDGLAYTNKIANVANTAFRGLLTEYNPVFLFTNAVKDVQDVLINSQHPARTYARIPQAIAQIATGGHWNTEYTKNGGEQNTYFDGDSKTFTEADKGIKQILGQPLRTIAAANNFIERIPRLAEYIASREAGKSIEVSMLDAARVTTNFAAGGDVTKFLNRNGATFLNASVQGTMQQVRNIREAKMNGLKGYLCLATKFALAGLPAVILNNLVWDDDDEYEELSDYVKQNYYVVAKFGDGQFVRIPKGRTVAVIQEGLTQMQNLITGDNEADFGSFMELLIGNLAPNNPIDNNLLAPVMQVMNNKTWYGEDLVPTRLQDLPAAEQYDESTDALSKWLGEKIDVSPYKLNYLLNQYSGGAGDVLLPMMTPEAERGDNSILGNFIAPFKDKFTTDGVLNNQNISDFYDAKQEMTTNAKSSKATDDDVLKNKYLNAVNDEISELYKQKREVQNSNLSDAEKYEQVRDIQSQIVELTRNALDSYENIERDGDYAKIGDVYFEWYTPESGESYWRKLTDEQKTKHLVTSAAGDAPYATNGDVHYRRDEDGKWTKISDRQLERQKEVTKALGITPEEYWSETEISFMPMTDGEYEYAYENPETYAVSKVVGGYDAFSSYKDAISDLKADKDANGKTISGSKKSKVTDYINSLDELDYGQKIILYRSQYDSKADKAAYDDDIVEYLNGRDDLSYEDRIAILKKLGFTISEDGETVSW